jgi:hypothetical protein
MLDLITEITAITGRMKPLPDWTQQGAVAGLEGGTEVLTYIYIYIICLYSYVYDIIILKNTQYIYVYVYIYCLRLLYYYHEWQIYAISHTLYRSFFLQTADCNILFLVFINFCPQLLIISLLQTIKILTTLLLFFIYFLSTFIGSYSFSGQAITA